MRPFKKLDHGQQDLFRSRLDQIINLRHPLSQLCSLLNWQHLNAVMAEYYSEHGRPGLAIRLILGLHL